MWYLFDLGQCTQDERVDIEDVDYEEVSDEDEVFGLD